MLVLWLAVAEFVLDLNIFDADGWFRIAARESDARNIRPPPSP